jgi:hypothetical protein
MRTGLPRDKIIDLASTEFGPAGYRIRSHSETDIVFQDGKDIDWGLAWFLLVFGVVIGLIIYLISVRRRQIIVSFLPLDGQTDVLAAGSSEPVHKFAQNFLKTL